VLCCCRLPGQHGCYAVNIARRTPVLPSDSGKWGFLRVWAFPRGGRIRSNRAAGFEKSIKRLGKFPERNL
jgi:hypothetical protein